MLYFFVFSSLCMLCSCRGVFGEYVSTPPPKVPLDHPRQKPGSLTPPLEFAIDEDHTLDAKLLTGLHSVYSFVMFEEPTQGALELLDSATGQFRYIPKTDDFGEYSFSYWVVAEKGGSSRLHRAKILIRSVNDLPTYIPQELTLKEDETLRFVPRFEDVDGDRVLFEISVQPSKAAASISEDSKTIVYQPRLDLNGADQVAIEFRDPSGTLLTAIQTIAIIPVNDAPVAIAQNVQTREDAPISILLSGTDVDGDVLIYAISTPPTKGTLSEIGPDRRVTYTPNPDANGPDSFTFSVRDRPVGVADGLSSTASVSIAINPVNDAPVATAQSFAVLDQQIIVFQVPVFDVDHDTTQLTSTVSAIDPNLGQLRSLGAHRFEFTPVSRSDDITLSSSYTVTDPLGGSSTDLLNIRVEAQDFLAQVDSNELQYRIFGDSLRFPDRRARALPPNDPSQIGCVVLVPAGELCSHRITTVQTNVRSPKLPFFFNTTISFENSAALPISFLLHRAWRLTPTQVLDLSSANLLSELNGKYVDYHKAIMPLSGRIVFHVWADATGILDGSNGREPYLVVIQDVNPLPFRSALLP